MVQHLRSMTGYGESRNTSSHGLIHICITSINHRALYIECKLPPPLAEMEEMIRSHIKKQIARGRITLTLTWSERPQNSSKVTLDESLLEQLKPLFERSDLPEQLFSGAAQSMGLVQIEETLADKAGMHLEVEKALKQALSNLIIAKEREGKALEEDLSKAVLMIEKLLLSIDVEEERSHIKVEKNSRLKETGLENSRIAQEIALLIDKADVNEELVRIQHHLDAMKNIYSSACYSKGKRLDFVAQELSREAGTLTRKVSLETSRTSALEMRHEIEKIREHLANVE